MTNRSVLLAAITVILLPLITSQDIGCDSPKPDFKAPGRRISEQKCHEYNWERKKLGQCSKETPNTGYPYVGAVGQRKKDSTELTFRCGAFLVSPKFAVTDAHCANHIETNKDTLGAGILRLGNTDINNTANVPRVDVKIFRSFVHPEFKPPKKAFNIGLLELEEALPWSVSVQPACLWTQPSLPDIDTAFVPGWASGKHSDWKQSDKLEVMTVKVLSKETCEPLAKKVFNRDWAKIEDHQFCADESVSSITFCRGSAGLPLMTTGKLGGDEMPYAVGVTSFGTKCRAPNPWGVYTRVSSFVDWIEQAVWPNEASL